MYIDAVFDFGIPAITDSTTATASTNYHDAGSSKIVFGGEEQLYLWFRATITADASPSIKVDLVASSATDLDPNGNESVENIVLASSGVVEATDAGVALASGDTVEKCIAINPQRSARRYYGLLVTLGGTNPDTTAQDAYVVRNPQSNMIGARAAVPA